MKNASRLFSFVLAIWLSSSLVSAKPNPPRPANSGKDLPAQQLMVVVTDNWSTLQGKLYCFQKKQGKWILKFSNAIVVGSKGLGIGDGIIPFTIAGAPVKKEGDMKSPAGIFTIGTAFGYADKKDATWLKTPYVKASDTLICVDDASSSNYNKLVLSDTAKNDYKSHEEMHLKADYYKWGLFVNHNSGKAAAGDGSCIFLHIWGNANEGTAGCTAMTESHMLRLLHWIKTSETPMLVQFPRTAYKKIRAAYNLPSIGQ